MKSTLSVLLLSVAIGLTLASGGQYGGHGGGGGLVPDVDIDVDVDVNFDFKGKWSSWESWGTCSKTCGGGSQARWRICVKPKNKFLGNFLGCDGSSSQTRNCNDNGCPVDGMWSNWSNFRTCSKTCGGGIKRRDRRCNNPAPSNGGKTCEGPGWESAPCNTQGCPVDGMWSPWGSFRSCSKTCGGGIKKRDRRCNNPAPSNGGKNCVGAGWESAACNTQGCPVDGMWSPWGSFRSCSKKCGGGIKKRDRRCNNPAPSNGGKKCEGPGWESMTCNTQKCPVDGMWTTWGPFGPCSKKCGGGIRTRDRSCTNPRPAYGGKDCKGSAWDKQKCNKHRCH